MQWQLMQSVVMLESDSAVRNYDVPKTKCIFQTLFLKKQGSRSQVHEVLKDMRPSSFMRLVYS